MAHRIMKTLFGKKKRAKKPAEVDHHAATELELYADNTQGVYRRQEDYLKNMARRMKKGTYDADKGAKLWLYYVNFVAQNYTREHGSMGDKWGKMFPMATRKYTAEQLASRAYRALKAGEYPHLYKA